MRDHEVDVDTELLGIHGSKERVSRRCTKLDLGHSKEDILHGVELEWQQCQSH